MKEYSNTYTQKIYSVLVPIVGTIVAHSILKTVANKLGKTEEKLTADDSSKIVEAIRKGLVVFIGSDALDQLAEKIKQIR